jgi:hypothetical protein
MINSLYIIFSADDSLYNTRTDVNARIELKAYR